MAGSKFKGIAKRDKKLTCHSMYLRQSHSQAFHRIGKVVTYTMPDHKLQIASVVPQGMKVLLTGIGISKTTTPTTLLSWYTQLEHITLATEWQLQLNI